MATKMHLVLLSTVLNATEDDGGFPLENKCGLVREPRSCQDPAFFLFFSCARHMTGCSGGDYCPACFGGQWRRDSSFLSASHFVEHQEVLVFDTSVEPDGSIRNAHVA